MNHPSGLRGERLQQFLVLGTECVRPVRVHIQHAAHLAGYFQRHRQFRAHLRSQQDIARVAPHVAHARRLARAGHPAGEALADPQLEPSGFGRQTLGRMDFQKGVRWIDQHDGAAGRAH